MNIFVLDRNPIRASEMMCDKHIPKMIVESAQMMASALRRHGAVDSQMPLTKGGTPYKGGYKHHPCTVWAGDSWHNFDWLANHAIGLLGEYYMRFGKEHACGNAIGQMNGMSWRLPNGRLTPFALAMPDEYRPTEPSTSLLDNDTFAKQGVGFNADNEMIITHADGKDAVQAYRRYYHSKTFAKWEKGTPAPDWWMGVTA
jgi:hypothetical protein